MQGFVIRLQPPIYVAQRVKLADVTTILNVNAAAARARVNVLVGKSVCTCGGVSRSPWSSRRRRCATLRFQIYISSARQKFAGKVLYIHAGKLNTLAKGKAVNRVTAVGKFF